jgi:tetratricopeptide (TPR) repeat protein
MNKVESVGAKLSDAHEMAEQALLERRYGQAVAQFRRADKSENRPWARARIESGLVRALGSDGKLAEAGEAFLNIAGGRDDAEVMVLAPLIWLPDHKPQLEAFRQARQWLQDERALARLLAASWLFQTPEGEIAQKVLEQLATDPQQRVSWLARAQLWRSSENRTADEIERFGALIDKMPEPIRAGPQFMLARAYQQAGKHVDAALAYLWIPFVYAPDSELAVESTLLAAQASRRAGLTADAEKLFREVIAKHPETSWSREAQDGLKQAATSPPERN